MGAWTITKREGIQCSDCGRTIRPGREYFMEYDYGPKSLTCCTKCYRTRRLELLVRPGDISFGYLLKHAKAVGLRFAVVESASRTVKEDEDLTDLQEVIHPVDEYINIHHQQGAYMPDTDIKKLRNSLKEFFSDKTWDWFRAWHRGLRHYNPNKRVQFSAKPGHFAHAVCTFLGTAIPELTPTMLKRVLEARSVMLEEALQTSRNTDRKPLTKEALESRLYPLQPKQYKAFVYKMVCRKMGVWNDEAKRKFQAMKKKDTGLYVSATIGSVDIRTMLNENGIEFTIDT